MRHLLVCGMLFTFINIELSNALPATQNGSENHVGRLSLLNTNTSDSNDTTNKVTNTGGVTTQTFAVRTAGTGNHGHRPEAAVSVFVATLVMLSITVVFIIVAVIAGHWENKVTGLLRTRKLSLAVGLNDDIGVISDPLNKYQRM